MLALKLPSWRDEPVGWQTPSTVTRKSAQRWGIQEGVVSSWSKRVCVGGWRNASQVLLWRSEKDFLCSLLIVNSASLVWWRRKATSASRRHVPSACLEILSLVIRGFRSSSSDNGNTIRTWALLAWLVWLFLIQRIGRSWRADIGRSSLYETHLRAIASKLTCRVLIILCHF